MKAQLIVIVVIVLTVVLFSQKEDKTLEQIAKIDSAQQCASGQGCPK